MRSTRFGVVGLAPVRVIPLEGTDPQNPALCPIAATAGCTVAKGVAEEWRRHFTLRFSTGVLARAAGLALNQPYNEGTREVLATATIRTFVIAVSYGLAFEDARGSVRGWIDPTDANPAAWNLHLMPGNDYPKGHNPADRRDNQASKGRLRLRAIMWSIRTQLASTLHVLAARAAPRS